MSIKLMAEAMATSLPCSQKLVLIVLADRANDSGGSIWESVGEIGRKSSLSDRQVQRTLRGFEAMGLLVCVSHANGGAPGMSRRYRINVPKLAELVAMAHAEAEARDAAELAAGRGAAVASAGAVDAVESLDDGAEDAAETGDMVSPVGVTSTTWKRETGDMVSPVGVTSATETGDMGVTRSVIDPSMNTNTPHTPQGGQARPAKPRLTLRGYLAACQDRGVKAVAGDDPVFRYAETVGIPAEFVGLAWRELKRRHVDGDKRYADWPKVLRNAVAGNWFRLWWTDGNGTFALTTQGQQARAWHQAAEGERRAA